MEKGGRADANSPKTQQEMFVFIALIAAQSAGNVRAKVFRSVVQSACGYQHLAGTMEDKCDQTVCVLFWKDEGCG